ncbi:MAG: hypothetical protein KDA58_06100, partial [Planctomycetaceae bacterium]|nr:hypothetical protein [Planctomycetaceae bacterium]
KLLKRAKGVMIFFEHFPYLIRSAGVDHEEYLQLLSTIGADAFYEVHGGLQSLGDFEGFLASARGLDDREEKHIEGPGSDYILSRNMNLGGLQGIARGPATETSARRAA